MNEFASCVTTPCRRALRSVPLLCVVVAALGPVHVVGQEGREITTELLRDMMPAAERFSAKEGDPPVFRGFGVDPSSGSETLVGYVFLTSDLPPEPVGFNGPVRVLVGMDLEGRLTGIRVMEYWESLRTSRGDFLARPGFQSRFSGKHVTEPFRVRRDVDGITGATITVAAMAAGIRNAARRVAAAYLTGSGPPGEAEPGSYIGTISEDELSRLSWSEMLSRGLAAQVVSMERGFATLFVSLAYLRDEAVGEILLGPASFQDVRDRYAEASAEGRHLMMLGVDGSAAGRFRPQSVFFVQEGDTVWVSPEHFFEVNAAMGGTVEGQFHRVGLLLVERALDVTRPFTIMLEPGRAYPEVMGRRPNLGQFSSDEYVVEAVAVAPALVTETAPASVGPEEFVASTEVLATEEESPPGSAAPTAPADAVAPSPGPTAQTLPTPTVSASDFGLFDSLYEEEEETLLSKILEETSWARVVWLLLLLGLVSWAFFTKSSSLRWVTLGATLLYLGFVDGGFLSVSHIIAGISVGPGVYLTDLPLLLIVTFTVGTTLLWGRVFCGFLCPFGALQDFIERIVPRRFRRGLPRTIHHHALYVKYAVLLLVLAPALLGLQLSLFGYFEPFGTVFFLSRSVLLWAIAVGILAACIVVPRFYCRYVCPLGAALALGSLLAPFRIRRVEACTVCKVCEVRCPTGAIRGPEIDFKECVRCNICEINLIQRAGECRHDFEEVRPRLVNLQTSRTTTAR